MTADNAMEPAEAFPAKDTFNALTNVHKFLDNGLKQSAGGNITPLFNQAYLARNIIAKVLERHNNHFMAGSEL